MIVISKFHQIAIV